MDEQPKRATHLATDRDTENLAHEAVLGGVLRERTERNERVHLMDWIARRRSQFTPGLRITERNDRAVQSPVNIA